MFGFSIAEKRDEESGLYYIGARYYCPWLARWLAPDPINNEWYNLCHGNHGRNLELQFVELTASSYEYCYANPVRFTDPTGEQVTWRNDKVANRRMIAAGQNAWQSSHPGVPMPQPRLSDVLRADMFGRGYAGSEATVNAKINAVRNEYYNAVSDAIASGPFAAYGMLTNGPEGALKWSRMDQLVMSYAGAGTPYGVTEPPGRQSSIETQSPTEQLPVKKPGFARLGYSYQPKVSQGANGSKEISHNIVQEGNKPPVLVGYSIINSEGVLTNAFEIPANLKQKQISIAMYSFLKQEGFTSVETGFSPASDNYKEFMKVYDSDNPGSMVDAALATPAAKAMGPEFWPTDINVVTKDNVVTKIDINWTRK